MEERGKGEGLGVVLFYTTASALRAEKLLAQAVFPTRLVPSPRRLTTDCGMALRFPWERREEVEEALRGASLEVSGIHPL